LSLPVDVREHPAEYTVVADLPGVEPTTVEVNVDGDVLTITGARRDRLGTGGVPVRLERPTGKSAVRYGFPPAATEPRSIRGSATVCSRSPCRSVLVAVQAHARR
jgi:HSP20 family protein